MHWSFLQSGVFGSHQKYFRWYRTHRKQHTSRRNTNYDTYLFWKGWNRMGYRKQWTVSANETFVWPRALCAEIRHGQIKTLISQWYMEMARSSMVLQAAFLFGRVKMSAGNFFTGLMTWRQPELLFHAVKYSIMYERETRRESTCLHIFWAVWKWMLEESSGHDSCLNSRTFV